MPEDPSRPSGSCVPPVTLRSLVSAPSQVLAGVLPEEQVSHPAPGRHWPLSGCQERGPGVPWQSPNLPVSSQAFLVSFRNDFICRNGC